MMSEPDGGWRQHMHLDADSRRGKARKLVALIERQGSVRGRRVLEIGTGTGVICAELARAVGAAGEVVSIDTMDTRVDTEGYTFQLTSGVRLPFGDQTFDVVVSNHVVEHVGGRADQRVHLGEIRRVLDPTGLGYVATPSRWALVEPHFNVPLLSWLPRFLRSLFLRVTRRGRHYDVDPLSRREIGRAFREVGLDAEDMTLAAVEELLRVESPSGLLRLVAHLPRWVLRMLRPVMPTMAFVVRPAPRLTERT